MNDLEAKNDMRSMMKTDSGDNKLDKSNELNETMTISENSQDEFTRTIHNIGGAKNG